MSKRSNENQTYPFYWLDEIVEITLNPARVNINEISPELLQGILQRLPEEIAAVTARLKAQAFCLYHSDQVRVFAGHYDQSVRLLQKQATANLSAYPRSGTLRQVGELILDGLHQLCQCLQSRYPAFLPATYPPAETSGALQMSSLSKTLCALSADQLGILLRAATDAGVLVGRSFRTICKAIAPFLSTPWKKDIQADTLRSHATRPENRDKEIAIAVLEKMIRKIKDYR